MNNLEIVLKLILMINQISFHLNRLRRSKKNKLAFKNQINVRIVDGPSQILKELKMIKLHFDRMRVKSFMNKISWIYVK